MPRPGAIKAIMRDAGMTSIPATGPAGKVDVLSEGNCRETGNSDYRQKGVRIYRVSNGNEDFIYAKVGRRRRGCSRQAARVAAVFQSGATISMSDTDSLPGPDEVVFGWLTRSPFPS